MPTRSRWTLLVPALALAAANPLPLPAQLLPVTPPEEVGISTEKLAEASMFLGQMVVERKIAGAVAAVARRGELVMLHTVGMRDLTAIQPMDERTLFRIYSMTKPITAIAVMMLHEEGRFQLDDPVSRYIPEFERVYVQSGGNGEPRPPVRPITVEDLLLHTSGLSHRTSELYRDLGVRSRADSLPVFVDKIVDAPLMEDPGTRFRYSESPTVLGRLVEVWTGQPFETFLDERIFRPLGMVDTGFWVRPDQRGRLATVYGAGEGGRLSAVRIEEVPFTERPGLIEGAVGLVSTVPDFLRFSQMLLNGGELDGVRILTPETVRRITSNGLPGPILAARGSGAMGWGLANVNVVIDPGNLSYPAEAGEYGWDGTAGTIFWIDPAKELITILMTQSSPANPEGIRQRFKLLVEEALIE